MEPIEQDGQQPKEAIVALVGFLGAGKTTLLKRLTQAYANSGWSPFVILNDYENAYLDAQQLSELVAPNWLKALNGSCICCSGIQELRGEVNRIPERKRGITLIEANGTSDAAKLMGFLGVGLHERFLPPVQISVVDAKNWQRRGEHNELEANQVQVSTVILLTRLDQISDSRHKQVVDELSTLNPLATVMPMEAFDHRTLPQLQPSSNQALPMAHHKAHWSSCSVDLPPLPDYLCIQEICDAIGPSVLRIKGCTVVGNREGYLYFERCPDGEVYIRPYNGEPETGTKLLAVGPGSVPEQLNQAVAASLESAKSRISN